MDVQYETDFVAWTEGQAELLHKHRFELEALGIDVANLVDEVETLGRSVKRELQSRLTVLLEHLLKWQYQPKRQRRSWRNTISNQREDIDDLLNESLSLRQMLDPAVKDRYRRARERAARATELNLDTFPTDCPWTTAQVLDVNFWPNEQTAPQSQLSSEAAAASGGAFTFPRNVAPGYSRKK
jgi:hypothetical protein